MRDEWRATAGASERAHHAGADAPAAPSLRAGRRQVPPRPYALGQPFLARDPLRECAGLHDVARPRRSRRRGGRAGPHRPCGHRSGDRRADRPFRPRPDVGFGLPRSLHRPSDRNPAPCTISTAGRTRCRTRSRSRRIVPSGPTMPRRLTVFSRPASPLIASSSVSGRPFSARSVPSTSSGAALTWPSRASPADPHRSIRAVFPPCRTRSPARPTATRCPRPGSGPVARVPIFRPSTPTLIPRRLASPRPP